MRILHLSWEFPPLVYGGLGRHVHAIASAQVAAGHDVTVLTAADSASPAIPRLPAGTTRSNGVRVVRVCSDPPHASFERNLVGWVALLEHALVRAGLRLAQYWPPEVIHCHDWMVGHAGAALRELGGAPLVATIHATESGRHQGRIWSENSTAVHATEGWLTSTADALIACSRHMRDEIATFFVVPPEHITIIPNGVDLAAWDRSHTAATHIRSELAASGPVLVSSGRVEYEKGIQHLLAAMPRMREAIPGLRLVIAGRGSQEQTLREYAESLGLREAVWFTGWLPEADLHGLVAAADLVVVPSIYEPFGLVALEAAALGSPLAVAATGGLAEFAADGKRASTFRPGDPAHLAETVLATLADPAGRRARQAAATAALASEYSWAGIAARTIELYQQAILQSPKHRPPDSSGIVQPVSLLTAE
ncbi:MAG: glycosyltransferase family 4 protein [Candidatus Nanopelagicales bacterium]